MKKGQLPLEHIFIFSKTFKMITKQLGFDLTFKTAVLHGILYTAPANDITITIKTPQSFVPANHFDSTTQKMLLSFKNVARYHTTPGL